MAQNGRKTVACRSFGVHKTPRACAISFPIKIHSQGNTLHFLAIIQTRLTPSVTEFWAKSGHRSVLTDQLRSCLSTGLNAPHHLGYPYGDERQLTLADFIKMPFKCPTDVCCMGWVQVARSAECTVQCVDCTVRSAFLPLPLLNLVWVQIQPLGVGGGALEWGRWLPDKHTALCFVGSSFTFGLTGHWDRVE